MYRKFAFRLTFMIASSLRELPVFIICLRCVVVSQITFPNLVSQYVLYDVIRKSIDTAVSEK